MTKLYIIFACGKYCSSGHLPHTISLQKTQPTLYKRKYGDFTVTIFILSIITKGVVMPLQEPLLSQLPPQQLQQPLPQPLQEPQQPSCLLPSLQ